MQRQQTGRALALILALLMGTVVALWAQGQDTPIVILDGSLTITSAVSWDQFVGTGNERSHPNASKAITSVQVTMPGKNQTITFSNQQCVVDVIYAGTDIKVISGADGHGLKFSPFNAFNNGHGSAPLSHKNQTAKISHVTVQQAGKTVFDSAASGGTKVTIHYR
jgi:hypothetical protein